MEVREPKRESGIAKITGASVEEERRLLDVFKTRLERQEILPFERAKTPEELEIILEVVVRLDAFAREYGAKTFPVGPAQIHFIESADLPAETRQYLAQLDEQGRYYPEAQAIVIFPDGNRLKTAQTMAHELLHLYSFTSLTKQDDQLALRRSGLSVFDRDGKMAAFDLLDEAVIEELTRRFDERYLRTIAPLADGIGLRDRLRREQGEGEALEIASIATEAKSDGTREARPVRFGYPKARRKLTKLIDEIFVRCSDECESREVIFRRFTDAVLAGKLLPFARLLERTYGRGAFRRLGLESERQGG